MVRSDPFTPETKRFECRDCLYRETTEERRPTCPNCGGEMKNISVPRE